MHTYLLRRVLASIPTLFGVSVLIFIAMCAILGLYVGVFGLIFFRIAPDERFHRWLLIPLAWAATEFARTYLLTGFPWNAFGYAFATPLPLAQTASLIGLWGITALAVYVYASPAVWNELVFAYSPATQTLVVSDGSRAAPE